MDKIFPVVGYSNTKISVIQGLKQRFREEEPTIDLIISTEKPAPGMPTKNNVITVSINEGDEDNGNIRNDAVRLNIYTKTFEEAELICEKTAFFLKTLPMLGKGIKSVSIQNYGMEVKNESSDYQRLVVAFVFVRASITKIY